VVGSMLPLEPERDWLVPQYRELVAYVHHGYPLERITANYLGKGAAGRIPDGVNVLPTQVALAPQLQHAVGLAWGLKLQKQPGVCAAPVAAVARARAGEGPTLIEAITYRVSFHNTTDDASRYRDSAE